MKIIGKSEKGKNKMKKLDKCIQTETIKSEKNGITLIALVVTIVILIILAGISIGVLTGENGLLEKARKCKRASRNSKWKRNSRTSISASNGKT